jgi:hypothetical protein
MSTLFSGQRFTELPHDTLIYFLFLRLFNDSRYCSTHIASDGGVSVNGEMRRILSWPV